MLTLISHALRNPWINCNFTLSTALRVHNLNSAWNKRLGTSFHFYLSGCLKASELRQRAGLPILHEWKTLYLILLSHSVLTMVTPPKSTTLIKVPFQVRQNGLFESKYFIAQSAAISQSSAQWLQTNDTMPAKLLSCLYIKKWTLQKETESFSFDSGLTGS